VINSILVFWVVRHIIINSKWPEIISNHDPWGNPQAEAHINRNLKKEMEKWKWIGHTLRKPSSDNTKAALEWNPQGTRKRGRPSSKENQVANLHTGPMPH
jgi:hypothetical protein